MFTHLAWIWWAADPVRLMLDTRKEMESLRRWRLSDRVWRQIEPEIRSWVFQQLLHHYGSMDIQNVHALARKHGKHIHTHILYDIILPKIRPVHVYRKHRRFEDTLRRPL